MLWGKGDYRIMQNISGVSVPTEHALDLTNGISRQGSSKKRNYQYRYEEFFDNKNNAKLIKLETNIAPANTQPKWVLSLMKMVTPTKIVKFGPSGGELSRTTITDQGKLTTINGVDGFIKNGNAEFTGSNLGNILDVINNYNSKTITRYMKLLLKH